MEIHSSLPHTQQEAEDIRLLLFVQFPNVLVGTHVAGCGRGSAYSVGEMIHAWS